MLERASEENYKLQIFQGGRVEQGRVLVSPIGWCRLHELVVNKGIGFPCRLVPAKIILDWCLM